MFIGSSPVEIRSNIPQHVPKQFRKLPTNAKQRIQQRVEELVSNPFLGLKLRGQLEDFWKDRIGNYRIIYKIDQAQRRIIFYDVDLRKRVYD